MARADFSERHYELAINLELLHQSSQYFPPSQPEEERLGYDIAVVPAGHGPWAPLVSGLPGVGPGVDPGLAPATSLFLQYKRPDFISNRNGKQAFKREQTFGDHTGYYRIKLSKAQLEVLLELQQNFVGRATVCYAAGRFHTRRDFYSHKATRAVASNTLFLRLDDVRTELVTQGHNPTQLEEDHCWTYGEDGENGLLFSEPRRLEGALWEDFRRTLRQAPAEESWRQHVDTVAETLRGWRAESVEPRRRQLPRREDWQLKRPVGGRREPPMTPAMEAQETLDLLGIGWFLVVHPR